MAFKEYIPLSTADQKEHLQMDLAQLADSHASISNAAYTSIYCATFI